MHTSGSFDYKVINENIQAILRARSKLNNTTQVGMPFVKATTTIGGPGVPLLDGGIGFTLGLHAIDQDVKYEDIYSSQGSDSPLIGYTYANGKTRRIYAKNDVDVIASQVFDYRAELFTNSKEFIRIPPPGITNLTVGRNKNGLLAHAQLTVNIPSLAQLESLQKTFLIPGVGMIVEWGQQFALESIGMDATGELPDISYAMFPWHDKNRTLDILTRIAKNNFSLQDILENYVYPSSGQYMWMFGRVSNFTITTLPDGSFQSIVKIVGSSEDSWAYSTKNTVVPAKDASTKFFCASDTNSVYSYFAETATGLNLKTLLDDVEAGSKLKEWQGHVQRFAQGNVKEGDPKAPDAEKKKPTVNQNTFADLEDAYFMTWRFFVNVVLNNAEFGLKRIFTTVVEKDVLEKIGMLLPYANGPERDGPVATNSAIDDPLEPFAGYNKYLRSIDPSIMIIVNEEAAELAAANDQYKSAALGGRNLLEPTDESEKFKAIGQYDTAAPDYNKGRDSKGEPMKDRSFLSTGVWLNHKTVVESMIGGDTIVRGITNLLDRMNQATLNYWDLTLDTVEPLGSKQPSYNYIVIDSNVKENSQDAVSKFIDKVHVFNKYVRTDTKSGQLVGSELIECNIDLSLPKRLFSQIATLGLVQPEDLDKVGITTGSADDPADYTNQKTAKISDPNDTLRELYAITVLSPKGDSTQGPDLTILPRTQRAAQLAANGVCGKANSQTPAQTAGQGSKAAGISTEESSTDKRTQQLNDEKEQAQKLLDGEVCKKCEQCAPPTPTAPTGYSPTAAGKNALQNALSEPGFKEKLVQICNQLGCRPEDMLKVMANESGILPNALNKNGGASGLIQFMPKTALALNTTTDALRRMTRVQQLDYVFQYYKRFTPRGVKLDSAGKLYAVTFLPGRLQTPLKQSNLRPNSPSIPSGIVLTSEYEISRPDFYTQNRGLDVGGDGFITVEDLTQVTNKKATQFGITPQTLSGVTVPTPAPTPTPVPASTPAPTPTPTQPSPNNQVPANTGCTDQQYLNISIANNFGLALGPTSDVDIANGKELCKKCERAKQTVKQTTQIMQEEEKVKEIIEKKLRDFPHLQAIFRYVEMFPEYMVAEITDTANGNFANAFGASPGALSIGGDLILPGISGLRVGELFWIDRLPSFYKVFGAFQILSIEDVIDVSGWKTKIHARFNFLGNNWKTAIAEKFRRETNNARTQSG